MMGLSAQTGYSPLQALDLTARRLLLTITLPLGYECLKKLSLNNITIFYIKKPFTFKFKYLF